MEAIFYDGTLAAIATSRRIYLAPEISALGPDHPWRRMVEVMASYARDVQRGLIASPYQQVEAETFARMALMPEKNFTRLSEVPDEELARRLRSLLAGSQ